MRDQNERICPICGGKIWRGEKVILEGARMTVCSSCAQHGKKIRRKKSSLVRKRKGGAKRSSTPSYKARSGFRNVQVVPDFAKRIKKTRTSRNLNQEEFAQKLNEKPSLIRRFEANRKKPTLQTAKKIEREFGIKLLEKSDETEAAGNYKKFLKKSGGTSLGDIAFIKKKKD